MFTRVDAIGWRGVVAMLSGLVTVIGSCVLVSANPAHGWQAPCAAMVALAAVSLVAARAAPPR